jgi:hypothetical protein
MCHTTVITLENFNFFSLFDYYNERLMPNCRNILGNVV